MPSRWDEKKINPSTGKPGMWVTTRTKKGETPSKGRPPLEPMGHPERTGEPRPIGPPAPPTPTQTKGHGKRGTWYWEPIRKPKQETEPEE